MTRTGMIVVGATLLLAGCGGSSAKSARYSAHNPSLQASVATSINRLADQHGGSAASVQCVAPSSTSMTCLADVTGSDGTRVKQSFNVVVDDTTGKYIVQSGQTSPEPSASETTSTPSPAPVAPGPPSTQAQATPDNPLISLDGGGGGGDLAPVYTTRAPTMTVTGTVYPAGAALTVSGDPATPTSANYGPAPVTVTGNHFTLTVPVKRGENDFFIDGSSKNNFVFAITR